MIGFVAVLTVALGRDSMLKANSLLYATEAKLKQVVGPRTSPPKEPGIRFAHPGFYEVWVDGAGPGMTHLRLGLGKLIPWKEYVSELGLNPSHAVGHPVPVAPSPIPLFRNRLTLTGVTGLHDKSWKIAFVEYAVANKARLRALKPQIRAAAVGETRNKLIRSCYDWWSELDFTK